MLSGTVAAMVNLIEHKQTKITSKKLFISQPSHSNLRPSHQIKLFIDITSAGTNMLLRPRINRDPSIDPPPFHSTLIRKQYFFESTTRQKMFSMNLLDLDENKNVDLLDFSRGI
ncbi:hypothetical protein CDAR_369541 [Caerostris darwini]|uniref:Uncharacterized protein n=1 Tax=Caerostris darwini TaxID=1538125 RepID=A0AAV4S1B0_9ARAC|nr:hypothetical protein CDAR_369541 [Caerostris darwini]